LFPLLQLLLFHCVRGRIFFVPSGPLAISFFHVAALPGSSRLLDQVLRLFPSVLVTYGNSGCELAPPWTPNIGCRGADCGAYVPLSAVRSHVNRLSLDLRSKISSFPFPLNGLFLKFFLTSVFAAG